VSGLTGIKIKDGVRQEEAASVAGFRLNTAHYRRHMCKVSRKLPRKKKDPRSFVCLIIETVGSPEIRSLARIPHPKHLVPLCMY